MDKYLDLKFCVFCILLYVNSCVYVNTRCMFCVMILYNSCLVVSCKTFKHNFVREKMVAGSLRILRKVIELNKMILSYREWFWRQKYHRLRILGKVIELNKVNKHIVQFNEWMQSFLMPMSSPFSTKNYG